MSLSPREYILHILDEIDYILTQISDVDIDSNRIDKDLTAEEKRLYLREIKKDIKYFGKTYDRAHFRINISGLAPKQEAYLVKEALK